MARMKNFEVEMTSMQWVNLILFVLEQMESAGFEMSAELMADTFDTFRFHFEKLNCDEPAFGVTLIEDLQRVQSALLDSAEEIKAKMDNTEILKEIGVLGYKLERTTLAIELVSLLDKAVTERMLEFLQG